MLDILQQLPLTQFRRVKKWARNRWATKPWPETVAHVTVDAPLDVIEPTLRSSYFEDASGWSLYYEGEVLNMRRPTVRAPDGTPQEDHLRFRPAPDGYEVNGHREPCRWEAQETHLASDRVEWLSEQQLSGLLEDCGFPTDLIDTETES